MDAKILIVDDEENVLRVLGYALEAEGFKVVTAETGEEALAKVDGERPGLIILDIMLPGISGIEVCQQLRSEPHASYLPIIMLSARAQVADRIDGLKAGADEYVTKPFDTDEIVVRLAVLLQRRAELLAKRASSEPPTRGRIVAVYGAKGGVGKTVIAANLAVAISETAKKRVTLVDADTQSGDVAVLLEVYPHHNLLDLLARADDLDQQLIESVLTRHSSGIDVLIAPDNRCENEFAEAPSLMRVLTTLREAANYIVVDFPQFPNPCALAGLEIADETLLVTTPEVTAIRRIQRFLEAVRSLKQTPAPPHIILNRHDQKGKVTVADIEKALTCKLHTIIPDNPSVVTHSVNQGVPFMVSHPESDVSKCVLKLAEAITGDGTDQAAGASVKGGEAVCRR